MRPPGTRSRLTLPPGYRQNIPAMANRSWTTDALILSLSTWGEGNREALFLTPEGSLQRASVFGGAKSRLRAQVGPWQTGKLWLYTDPVKKSTKITDIDVKAWRQGIRESLVRTWCASLCVEIVSKSHGSADWRVVNAFLDGISVSDDDECRRGLIRFLWRYLLGSGLNPDTARCGRCGADADRTLGDPFRSVLFYSPHEDGFLCPDCARREERLFPLSPPALLYLDAVERLSPSETRSLPLEREPYGELRSLLFFLLSRAMGGPLKTLETGEGIL